MRSDELVTASRRAAFIADTHPEYTSAVCLDELNRTFTNVFGKLITDARGGYWLKQYITTTTANVARYRIPPRALVGGLERIEIANASGFYQELDQATPAEISVFAGSTTSNATIPSFFYVEGDQIVLLPLPATTGFNIRMSYYARPSRLVTQQSSTLGGGTVRGQITAVNTSARTITVNVVPFDQELGTPAAITSANQKIDVVHPDGWRELALVGASQTLAGSTFTVGGTDPMADIQVGDFVRAAEQTDWPCLPEEFHQTLADATGARILMALGAVSKASALLVKIGLAPDGERPPGTDLARFVSIITPRVKRMPGKVVRRTGIIAGGARRRWLDVS